MEQSNYKQSRDLAWFMLNKYQIIRLPVKISELCIGENLNILSYEKGHRIIKQFELQSNCRENDGFLFRHIIFYNEKCTIQRQRFTVAHELGHALLGHSGELINREPNAKDNPKEQAANVFASRILSPACVMWGLGVKSWQEIQTHCDISKLSAQFRMERLKLLYERETQFLTERGHSCFLLSPLERQVFDQFRPYISEIIGGGHCHPQLQKASYPQVQASQMKTFLSRFSRHDDR